MLRRVRETPQRQRLDRRLAKGRLRTRHLRAVARAIAARRDRAEADGGESEAGSPDALARRVADLTAKLESQPSATLRSALGVLLAYQRRFLEDAGETLRARLAEGRVGALHGRLACDTVWVEGEARVRFASPGLHAEGDVAEDVARLALDLRARGGARSAEQLAAAYALAADDYGLYRVLGFYERDAACQLALEAAAGEDGEPLEPDAFVQAALAPLAAPVVIAVGGGVASGKTLVAKALAQRLAAPRVSGERVAAALRLPARGLAHELLLGAADAERLYAGLAERASAALAGGRSVVLDACFGSGPQRAAAAALAARHGARFLPVHCGADAATLEARLRARDLRDGTSVLGWHSLARDFAARCEPPAPDALVVDTAQDWSEALFAALAARLP